MTGSGSVPIVSQTEIDPTKTALSLMLALATTAALAEPLPLPKPRAPGGSFPHGYITSGSFCAPTQGAADAIAKPLMDWAWLLLLAKWTRAALAFALRFVFSLDGHPVPRGSPPRRLRIGSPEPGDEQEGAWPRERLEAMGARFVERAIERGEERPPMHRSAEEAK